VKPRAIALWLSHLLAHTSVSPGTDDLRPMLARLEDPSEPGPEHGSLVEVTCGVRGGLGGLPVGDCLGVKVVRMLLGHSRQATVEN
jgi:hypothetical protein